MEIVQTSPIPEYDHWDDMRDILNIPLITHIEISLVDGEETHYIAAAMFNDFQITSMDGEYPRDAVRRLAGRVNYQLNRPRLFSLGSEE